MDRLDLALGMKNGAKVSIRFSEVDRGTENGESLL